MHIYIHIKKSSAFLRDVFVKMKLLVISIDAEIELETLMKFAEEIFYILKMHISV